MRGAMIASLMAVAVSGHGILTDPVSRLGLNRPGTQSKKYTHGQNGTNGQYPLSTRMLRTCGYMDDEVPRAIVKNYVIGDTISFSWKLTLPHAAGNGNREYVRLGIKYDFAQDFADNILFLDVTDDASGSQTQARDAIITKTATATLNQACNNCRIQWVWDSETDGGGYIDCADIRVNLNTGPTSVAPPTAVMAPTVFVPPVVGQAPTPGNGISPTRVNCGTAGLNVVANCMNGKSPETIEESVAFCSAVSSGVCAESIGSVQEFCTINDISQTLSQLNTQLAACGDVSGAASLASMAVASSLVVVSAAFFVAH